MVPSTSVGRRGPGVDRARPRLELRVRGFGRQGRVSVERIVAGLDALPRFHLEGLREIEYDPERLGQKAAGYFLPPRVATPLPNLKCRAEFLTGEEKVAVYEFESEQDLLYLVYHEIGHHVFQSVLGSVARKRWTTEIHPETAAVSSYASRNACEDFAETYATFVTSPDRLRNIPRKHAFMRETVFADPGTR